VDDAHVCFGCQQRIGDQQPHIHVGLDEWSDTQGLPAFGLDDLLTFPFCEACTVKSRRGRWQYEAHAIADPDQQEATP
jgi:hypothetical protein